MTVFEALRHARCHLIEIEEHIAAQRMLIGELRSAGRETAEQERLLRGMLEARMDALAHWCVARSLRPERSALAA